MEDYPLESCPPIMAFTNWRIVVGELLAAKPCPRHFPTGQPKCIHIHPAGSMWSAIAATWLQSGSSPPARVDLGYPKP